jgi:hypothetical protein
MSAAKRKTAKSPGFRMYPEDLDLIAKIRLHLEPKMGPRSMADLIRMGLRSLHSQLEAETEKR